MCALQSGEGVSWVKSQAGELHHECMKKLFLRRGVREMEDDEHDSTERICGQFENMVLLLGLE